MARLAAGGRGFAASGKKLDAQGLPCCLGGERVQDESYAPVPDAGSAQSRVGILGRPSLSEPLAGGLGQTLTPES